MGSLNDSMVRAEKLGRQAAGKERSGTAGRGASLMAGLRGHRPANSVGVLALDTFREHGTDGMKAVFRGYQAGYDGWSGGHALLVSAEERAA